MLETQTWRAIAAIGTIVLLGACTQPAPTHPDSKRSGPSPVASSTVPKVVATTTIICDMAKQIAANTIALTCPLKPASDPHIYEPTPADRKAIEEAKLVLYGGYDFEPNLIKIIDATSPATTKVEVHYVTLPPPKNVWARDPHLWHNAQYGIRMVQIIQTSLAKAAPQNAALYAKNARAVTEEIAQIDTWIKVQIATIPLASRRLVTTHDSLGYYSKAYGIPLKGALQGINTEEKPTARQVAALVKTIQDAKVPTIFAELTINPKLIETVASNAKVKVSSRELFADGLGEPGSEGDTYQKMLVANTKTIVEGLGGKYEAFQAK
jgi:manganese/iron transport system substrate-binding protein